MILLAKLYTQRFLRFSYICSGNRYKLSRNGKISSANSFQSLSLCVRTRTRTRVCKATVRKCSSALRIHKRHLYRVSIIIQSSVSIFVIFNLKQHRIRTVVTGHSLRAQSLNDVGTTSETKDQIFEWLNIR